jgi:hypothetical protein
MFNPIAQPKKGQEGLDTRRVWCDENVKIAYDAYEQGLPLISTPFITGSPQLRRPGLLYEWNDFELLEAAKCKKDILYFADHYIQMYLPNGTYGHIKLRKYQRRYLKLLQDNRFVAYVASRQIGKTTVTAIFLLWLLIFEPDYKCAVIGDKGATSIENVSKLKDMYIRLPFFLKPGVITWNQRTVVFDNGSSLISGPCNLSTLVGKTLRAVYCDEFAIPEDKVSREVFEFVLPTIVSQENARFVMTSSPRGAHGVFYETVMKAKMHNSPFIAYETHWYEVPGRDEKWKQQQVDIMGETGFAQQYDCQFLADDNAWLSAELTQYLNQLMLSAQYQPMTNLTDNEKALSNLSKVEKVVLKSKYCTKLTRRPKTKLVQRMQFDSKVITSLSQLKTMPIIIVIDTGEGRLNDYTTVNFYRPELDNDKSKLLQDAYLNEVAEIELNAKQQADEYEDEDDMMNAMIDVADSDIDAEDFDTDYMLSNGVRCRQIGALTSNEHAIPMVALFVQVFASYFLGEDNYRIVCELDGIGSKMQALIASDIIVNSGIDDSNFGHDDKGHPGVFMRGRNKAGYVYDTKQFLEDNRILATYGATVYELGKFQEVKPGKFMGVDAHDDQAMNIVQLGAYTKTTEYATFIEDMLVPDQEAQAADDDDVYDAIGGII